MTNLADRQMELDFEKSYDMDERMELGALADQFHMAIEKYGMVRVLRALRPSDDEGLFWYYNQDGMDI